MGMKYRGRLTRKSGKRRSGLAGSGLSRLDIRLELEKAAPVLGSMSDLFHEAVPAEFVAAVWRAMHQQHTIRF